jgi:3-oxo-5-alpha-steroid 4-dehydrogenase 1
MILGWGLYEICLGIVVGYSVLGWLILTGIKINYGRLSNSFAGIYINPKFGWFFFEIPNLLWAAYFYYLQHPIGFAYSLFILHYINRDIIYPLRLKSNTKVPLEIMLSAFSFTFANGYLQAYANTQPQN